MELIETREAEPIIGLEPSRAACHVLIDVGRCAGCQECVVRCPEDALTLDPISWTAVAHDEDCVGCRQCVRTCPYSAIEVEGPVLDPDPVPRPHMHIESLPFSTVPTRPGFPDLATAQEEAQRCLTCPDPTCVLGCPAHNDIPGFISAVREGQLDQAREILSATTVFPDICSRVCDQSTQCEGACSWQLAGGRPVSIGLLERFVADHTRVAPPRPEPPATVRNRQISVGIVGSGPAGLAASWALRSAGANVVIYERESSPLGVLNWGIPEFTLPQRVARRPLEQLLQAGVLMALGSDVGHTVRLSDLACRHDAIILAHGASRPLAARVPGADLPWVEDATTFLNYARQALDQGIPLPDLSSAETLLVLGAGNTAMDVARTARRLGIQKVLCVDWMDDHFARVRPDEVAEARAEGVEVRFLTSLGALAENPEGRHVAQLVRTTQATAQTRPRILQAATETLAVSRVVVAMGYSVEPYPSDQSGARLPFRVPDVKEKIAPRPIMASGLLSAQGPVPKMVLEREFYRNRALIPVAPRVWAIGDALSGPATVVAAMAQGLAVAREILSDAHTDLDRRLGTRGWPEVSDEAPVESSQSEHIGMMEAGGGVVAFGAISCVTIIGLPLGVPFVITGAFMMGLGWLLNHRATRAR